MSHLDQSTLVISVSGGIVTEMLSYGPIGAALLDYDTEGDDSDAIAIPQPHGKPALARLRERDNEDAPERVKAIAALLPPVDIPVSVSSAPTRAVVIMDGGVIQNVLADQPLRVIVVDYDIDGLDEVEEADLQAIPQKRGAPEKAMADDQDPEINPREVAQLYALWEKAPVVVPQPPSSRRPRPGR